MGAWDGAGIDGVIQCLLEPLALGGIDMTRQLPAQHLTIHILLYFNHWVFFRRCCLDLCNNSSTP